MFAPTFLYVLYGNEVLFAFGWPVVDEDFL